jgi:hypothetical protein
VMSPDGQRQIRLVTDGLPSEGRQLGLALAEEARGRGAEALLG